MKVKYDQQVDVLRIRFSSAEVAESDEEKPGIILDYDGDGNIVGIEILNASRRMEDPRSLEYAVAYEICLRRVARENGALPAAFFLIDRELQKKIKKVAALNIEI